MQRSRLGRAWSAIREDELAASCSGINTFSLKLIALGCAAAIAGLAGCVFAAKQGTITPDSFDFILSVMILAMVVLGGMGSVWGVVLGSIVLGTLPELLRGIDQYRMLLFGIVMVIIMRLRPQGILGSLKVQRGSTEKT
jgi:branched-chain amino acid transport system permease protein